MLRGMLRGGVAALGMAILSGASGPYRATAPAPAPAPATPAPTLTFHFSDVTDVISVNNPCYGRIVGSLTYDGVLHVTENANGYHTVVAIHGTAIAHSTDPSVPDLSGSFSEVQVLNLNRTNAEDAFVVTQRGASGMAFHITFHTVLSYPNDVKVEVFNFSCGA